MSTNDKYQGNPATDPGADFARQLEGFPPWGEVVTCAISGTGNQSFQHGLGRRFNAAVPVGQDYTIPTVIYTAATVELLGNDPVTELVLRPYASATGSLLVWVF